MENNRANLGFTLVVDKVNNVVKTSNRPLGENDEDGNPCIEFNLNETLLGGANLENGEYDVEVILKKK